jgi:hypothetical protein
MKGKIVACALSIVATLWVAIGTAKADPMPTFDLFVSGGNWEYSGSNYSPNGEVYVLWYLSSCSDPSSCYVQYWADLYADSSGNIGPGLYYTPACNQHLIIYGFDKDSGYYSNAYDQGTVYCPH